MRRDGERLALLSFTRPKRVKSQRPAWRLEVRTPVVGSMHYEVSVAVASTIVRRTPYGAL